jgi:zinc D-Ala-D-Ala carboxypeptidase
MGPIGGVTSAQARMAAIQSRFEPTAASPTALADPFVAGPPAVNGQPIGFEPFGTAYLKAVEAAPASFAPLATAPTLGVRNVVGASGSSGFNPVVGASGSSRFNPIVVAPELAAYGNGNIPRDALEPIGQGGHRLWKPAAEAWRGVVAAAAADGIDLRITDSYRNYEQQVDLAARKGLYRDGGYAAVPGTSNHGWGMAVDADVTNSRTLEWLRVNGPRFGFAETVPREPWHWEYRPTPA